MVYLPETYEKGEFLSLQRLRSKNRNNCLLTCGEIFTYRLIDLIVLLEKLQTFNNCPESPGILAIF
jgi:hypothetical protein